MRGFVVSFEDVLNPNSTFQTKGWSQLSDLNRRPTVYKTGTTKIDKYAESLGKSLFSMLPWCSAKTPWRHMKYLFRQTSCRQMSADFSLQQCQKPFANFSADT
jgi:hypothetical protein